MELLWWHNKAKYSLQVTIGNGNLESKGKTTRYTKWPYFTASTIKSKRWHAVFLIHYSLTIWTKFTLWEIILKETLAKDTNFLQIYRSKFMDLKILLCKTSMLGDTPQQWLKTVVSSYGVLHSTRHILCSNPRNFELTKKSCRCVSEKKCLLSSILMAIFSPGASIISLASWASRRIQVSLYQSLSQVWRIELQPKWKLGLTFA